MLLEKTNISARVDITLKKIVEDSTFTITLKKIVEDSTFTHKDAYELGATDSYGECRRDNCTNKHQSGF